MVYRYESDFNGDGDWRATDGADVINNFQIGTDRLVMVDTSGDGDPINNLAEFVANGDRPTIGLITNGALITGVRFTFDVDGDNAGKVLTVNFGTSDESTLVNWSTSGLQFSGVNSEFLTNIAQLDSLLFDGMIDFISPDGLPESLTII